MIDEYLKVAKVMNGEFLFMGGFHGFSLFLMNFYHFCCSNWELNVFG